MYIKKLNYQNIGPIASLNLDLPFNTDNNPKPMIVVGENGSGKSLILSSIIDAFYEVGGKVFSNVLVSNGLGHFYYKLSSSNEIKIGTNYTSSYVLIEENGKSIEYLAKKGKKNFLEWENQTGVTPKNVSWTNEVEDQKYITEDESSCKKLFEDNICCFFPPNRYSKPFWLSENYYKTTEITDLSLKQKFNQYLYNPITVENSYVDNISWLLDVICDSRIDVDVRTNFDSNTKTVKDSFSIPGYVNQNHVKLLKIARSNIELILSKILKMEKVFLRANYRGKGLERVYLVDNNENLIIPSLASLSSGQMALFNMFLNIIRYADNNDLNKSIKLPDIKGIVVIDEIELHLHTDLQYRVVPELIRLFPKIQFIVTTHSPLFILGMDKFYGKGKYEIVEMPNGESINAEEFSLFIEAYNVLKESKLYRNEINAIKQNSGLAPLIITEGASDWMHIKNAINTIKNDKSFPVELRDKLNSLEFEFLEYFPTNYHDTSKLGLDMGDSALIQMCIQFSKIEQKRKYIFIADRDKPSTIQTLDDNNLKFKKWGNNVYSFCIPIPQNRKTNDICIELYYSDEDIKRSKICENGVSRRIYLSSEFNQKGVHNSENVRCEIPQLCINPDKINILDGSSGKKVFINDLDQIPVADRGKFNKETNLGLSKVKYAESILGKSENFKDVKVDNFIEILNIISDIIDEK